MVHEDLKISKILVREAFENAIRVNAAIGGSTNAVIHLLAFAGRVGVELNLDDFDRLGHQLPLLVDLMPSGQYSDGRFLLRRRHSRRSARTRAT